MATVNPLISIGTTANAGQIQTFASDGAYVAAKGTAAADGDYFYQTVDDVIRLFANGAWTSIVNTPATAAKSADYTLTRADNYVTGDSDSAAFTFTLPDCATNAGKVYRIKKIGSGFATANVITIARAGSDTIFGTTSGTSTTLHTPGEEIEIASFGSTVWQIINRRIPSLWIAYTPAGTWIANSTYTGFWRRIGDSIQGQVKIALGGAPTSAALTVNLPTGITIDTAKLVQTDASKQMGSGIYTDTGTAKHLGPMVYSSTTAVAAYYIQSPSGSPSTLNPVIQNDPYTFANTDLVSIEFLAPITGWNG